MGVGIRVLKVCSGKHQALGIMRQTTMTEGNIEGRAVTRHLVDHIALKIRKQDSWNGTRIFPRCLKMRPSPCEPPLEIFTGGIFTVDRENPSITGLDTVCVDFE